MFGFFNKKKKEPINIDQKLDKELSKAIIQSTVYMHLGIEKIKMVQNNTWEENRSRFIKKIWDDASFSMRFKRTDLIDKIIKKYPSNNEIILHYEEDDIDKILDYNIALLVDYDNVDDSYKEKIEKIRKDIDTIKNKYGIKHCEEFIHYGYIDIKDIVNVPENEILRWYGVGEKKLEKIQTEQETARSMLRRI